jgi:hypothetical protein
MSEVGKLTFFKRPQIANSFTLFLCTNFNWSFICHISEEGYICELAKVLSLQIAIKIGSSNRKSAEGHGKKAYLKNYLSPQICVFEICGTYLRIAQLSKEHMNTVWGLRI